MEHTARLPPGTPGAPVESGKTLLSPCASAVLAPNPLSPHPSSLTLSACGLAASSGPGGRWNPDCVSSWARPWPLAWPLAHGMRHRCGVPGRPFSA